MWPSQPFPAPSGSWRRNFLSVCLPAPGITWRSPGKENFSTRRPAHCSSPSGTPLRSSMIWAGRWPLCALVFLQFSARSFSRICWLLSRRNARTFRWSSSNMAPSGHQPWYSRMYWIWHWSICIIMRLIRCIPTGCSQTPSSSVCPRDTLWQRKKKWL